jgi:hypothetical protein
MKHIRKVLAVQASLFKHTFISLTSFIGTSNSMRILYSTSYYLILNRSKITEKKHGSILLILTLPLNQTDHKEKCSFYCCFTIELKVHIDVGSVGF